MTAEELLLQNYNSVDPYSAEDGKCIIDPETRTISIPTTYRLLGVESDEKVERLYFQCPKIVGDNIDLSQLQIRINYQNASSQKDQYIVDDVSADGDNITFSWLLSRKVTAYRGTVQFIVCAVKVSGSTITNEWNTTLAQAQVLQGLEVDTPEPSEEQSDVIAQLIEMMNDTYDKSNQALSTAESIISGELQEIVPTVDNHIIVFDYISQRGE